MQMGVYDIGGCQDNILVKTGMLLCTYVPLGSALDLLQNWDLSVSCQHCCLGPLCSNQVECFSLFNACFANFVIWMILLFFKLCIFAMFSAFPKDKYLSCNIMWRPVMRHLSSMLLSEWVIIGAQNGTPTSQTETICCFRTSINSFWGHPMDDRRLRNHILV